MRRSWSRLFWLVVLLRRAGHDQRPSCSPRGFLICRSCLFSLIVARAGLGGLGELDAPISPLPTQFPKQPPDRFRIVVLGGSSALGEPYRPWLSVGPDRGLAAGAGGADRRFECEILAWLGDPLEMQHRKLAALKRRPGMVIIYSGHNEFAARYEEERDGWLDEEPGSAAAAAGLSGELEFAVLSPGLRDDQQEPTRSCHRPYRAATSSSTRRSAARPRRKRSGLTSRVVSRPSPPIASRSVPCPS